MGAWKVLREPDSARRYCGTAISLLAFCLRACFLPTTATPTRFTDEQLETLKDYKEYLTSVVDSSAADVERFQTALFSVLFRKPGLDITPAGRLSCPVQSYLALVSLRTIGDFVKPGLVTQPISRLMYLSRGAILQAALREHNNAEGITRQATHWVFRSNPLIISPCRTVKVLCEKHLGMGEGKISDELISLRKYASSLALREPGNPSILYNPDYTALAFRGQNLSFSNLQLGLNQLIQDTWTRLLAFTKNKIEVVLPPLMSEDVRSTAVGKSFIDEITTNPPSLPLLSAMSECSGLPLLRPKAQVGDGEMFEVDPSASEEFFHRVKPIVEAIAFLVHTTSSGPLRLSEVVEDRYRNGSNQRNLLISHGLVFLLRRNLKSSTLRGHRSSVIHFPPRKVVELLVYYLVVFRPVEVFLAASLGWADQHAAYTQFLWVVKGQKLKPQGLTDIVARHTDRYFKCRLTGSQLRHVLINIQSVFLPPIIDPSVQKLGDSQAGHGSNIANRVYGQRIDHLPGEEAAMFTLTYHWCQRVHSLLGLGQEDPPTRPLPHLFAPFQQVSLSGHAAPHSPSSDDIMRQVHHALNSGFSFATQELAKHCEKVLKESILQVVGPVLASIGSSGSATAGPSSFARDYPPAPPTAVSLQSKTFCLWLTGSL